LEDKRPPAARKSGFGEKQSNPFDDDAQMRLRIDQSGHRLDQAGGAVVECLELQLARLDFSEALRGAMRKRRSPPSFDCRSSWSKGGSMKNK
jgi:hypothetical protein